MPRRIRIYPYKQGSRSAKALAQAMGGKVLKLEGSRYVYRRDDLVINWGSTADTPMAQHMRNDPENIRTATNKLEAFREMEAAGVNIPPFWTDQQEIPDEAFPVFARTILNGHSGAGIVDCANRGNLVPAPLFVKYIKKKDEYRVHVVVRRDPYTNEVRGTSIIAVQRKALRNGHENPNWQVRNLDNGFVFVREGVRAPDAVAAEAIRAVEALGLDFGAVDVLWNERQEQAYVLEVNTAPGLEGQTIQDYVEGFKELVKGRDDN